MNAKSMFIGFAPWILFSVGAAHFGTDHVALAAVLAAAAALVLTIIEASRNSWKILDVAGVLTFGVIAAVGIVGNHQVDQFLVNFGRGGSTYVLAAVMAISAFTIPFTEQYARDTVDPALWHLPIFRAKNRAISLLWAGVVFAMATAHTVAGLLTETGLADSSNVVLNWILPAALMIYAIKRTRAIAAVPSSAPVVAAGNPVASPRR